MVEITSYALLVGTDVVMQSDTAELRTTSGRTVDDVCQSGGLYLDCKAKMFS